MGLAKYWEASKIGLFNSFVYSFDFFTGAIFIGLIIFIFINLWRVIYGSSDLIEGFTLGMMVWYLVLTEAITFSPGRITEEIGNEIQSGNIAQSLNKPYNYLLFRFASNIGRTILRFTLTFGISAIIAVLCIGVPSWIKVSTLPFIAVSVFLALVLNFCIMAAVGITAFWLEDSRSLNYMYSKFVFVLGGMLVPLEIFPSWLETISRNLPFSYVAYYPAKLWVKFSWSDILSVYAMQLLWIAVFIIFAAVLYNVCIKKISINGG